MLRVSDILAVAAQRHAPQPSAPRAPAPAPRSTTPQSLAPPPTPRSPASARAGAAGSFGDAEITLRFERVPAVVPREESRWVGRASTGMADPSAEALRRRQISHDMHHELGTIMMLASLLSCSPDVGPESRERARQILGEARWLDQLQRAYDDTVRAPDSPSASGRPSSIRLDTVASEVVTAIRLSTVTEVAFTAAEAWARTDQLAYWRAVRNIVGNAVRAAGPSGHVHVGVFVENGWVVSQIDDNGPGFGAAKPGYGSLGLGIVRDAAEAWGGELEIRSSHLGGCCVRLKLPVASPHIGDLGVVA